MYFGDVRWVCPHQHSAAYITPQNITLMSWNIGTSVQVYWEKYYQFVFPLSLNFLTHFTWKSLKSSWKWVGPPPCEQSCPFLMSPPFLWCCTVEYRVFPIKHSSLTSHIWQTLVTGGTELQKGCGYAVTTRKEGLSYVRLLRKVSTFNQQTSAESAGTRNKKPILNDTLFIYFAIWKP